MDEQNSKEMNTNNTHEDFQSLWERRKHTWLEKAKTAVPNDAAILRMAELARQQSPASEATVIPINSKKHNRWIPYAAAASLIIGVAAIGLNRQGDIQENVPVAEEVNVEGNTVFFLCNNGCSVQDVMIAANNVIKK